MIIEKIQYSDDFLKEENITKNINTLWGRALPILQHRKYLYDRYTRKYDTNDVVVALEFYISTIASGYFGGKEPQYKVNSVEIQTKRKLINLITSVNGQSRTPVPTEFFATSY